MRRSIATPCPVAANKGSFDEDTCFGDTTNNIEFTTAFQLSFRNVRPRRGQTARRPTTEFVIHEDADETGRGTLRDGSATTGTGSRLSRPARRVPTRINNFHGSSDSLKLAQAALPASEQQPARPRVICSAIEPQATQSPPSLQKSKSMAASRKENEDENKIMAKRPARRKTLYIPSDDTTQPTMWMGIFSPIKNQVISEYEEPINGTPELTGIAARMAERRKRRTSSIQPGPKRMPLGSNLTAQATTGPVIDRPGAITGKENLPPSGCLPNIDISKTKRGEEVPLTTDKDQERRKFLTRARLDNLSKPKNTSQCNSADVLTMYEVGKVKETKESPKPKKSSWNAGPKYVARSDELSRRYSSPKSMACANVRDSDPIQIKAPTRFVQPVVKRDLAASFQAPIAEHIQNPEMYEEDWLEQQEAALTQLLNKLFSQTQPTYSPDQNELRAHLLNKYNSPEINLLYNRVQAALLYGSLSLSHETMIQMQSLARDVGRKQKFLRFWIDNYDHELLRVALEVVTGMQVYSQTKKRSSQPNSPVSNDRASLARFIEAFLLRHEEAHFKSAGTGSASNDLGNRTILKCLMLAKALDMLKTDSNLYLNSCLFQRNAVFKSSSAAVQMLFQMLNPAVGDSLRALRQLGYEVFHEQVVLEEVVYHIDNIAVDLRDGILLTRLVEILLYRSATRYLERILDNDTNTIQMPEGETLLFTRQNKRPLSQHVKVPCASRAAKLWNTQIAIGALSNIKNIETMIKDVTAEDIVDGYREKTVKLLWTLVARFGIPHFVDHIDLRQEIRRLDPTAAIEVNNTDYDSGSQDECEYLLKKWTKAVAASKGLVVGNFTTSFSDGKIFEAILDEYEPYLVHTTAKGAPLNKRLLQLGCSRQFSDLFSRRQECVHIFGKDFVLAALVFLSSRVVGPSKLCRKVITIQRQWRAHWQATQIRRQAIRRGLAEACAASVNLKRGRVTGVTDPSPCDAIPVNVENPEICDDIWLSL